MNNSLKLNLIRAFMLSAGGVLLVAALAEFALIIENSPVLYISEPIFGIQLRVAIVMIGGMELIVAFICLFTRLVKLQTILLAWLMTNFLIYFVGLFWMHCPSQFTCIGLLTDPLHLSLGRIGIIAESTPIYLLLGSYASLIWLCLEVERAKKAKFVRMSCPCCGGHIRFAAQNLDQPIPCPHCKTGITLRKPENLRMSCFFCGEHIAFPLHAIGEKLPCPHCKMDITLQEPT